MRPCRNCPHKDGCEIKAEKQRALRGLGLTLVNFKCDKRLSQLQPGQRIELVIMLSPDETASEAGMCDGPDGSRILPGETRAVKATVMRPKGARILVWLDKETFRHRNPIAVHPDRVTPIEGMVTVCPVCQQPAGTKPADSRFYCHECNPEELEATT